MVFLIFSIYSASIWILAISDIALCQELCHKLVIVLSLNGSSLFYMEKRDNKQVPKDKIILDCGSTVEEIKRMVW